MVTTITTTEYIYTAVNSMGYDNWWCPCGITPSNVVAVYQPKGASSLSNSYINLVNPGSYNAYIGTAPTWDTTNGWMFNGSSQYLKTGVVPVSDQTWSAFIRFSNLVTSTIHNPFGYQGFMFSGFSFSVLFDDNNDLIQTWNNNDTAGSASNSTLITSGNYGISGRNAYRNGSREPNSIPSGTGGTQVAPDGIYIGALDYVGNASQFAQLYVQAFAVYNVTLSDTQVDDLYNAMAAL